MATVRSFSAVTAQLAPIVHVRLNEAAGPVIDQIRGLEGTVSATVERDVPGMIGDGGAAFDSAQDFITINSLSGTITVAAFGDSLIDGDTPGTNFPDGFTAPEDQYAVDLATALNGLGLDATVFDRGVAGETSGEALARVDDVLADNPDVVIVEFGTNDAIQEIDLATVEANLRELVGDLKAAGTEVLLTGTFGFYPERNGGVGYETETERDAFEAQFETIADDLGVTLLQDKAGSDKFLGGSRDGEVITGGVLGNPDLNVDGLHPNAEGIDQIVTRTLPQTVALGAAAGTVEEPLLLGTGTFETWVIADDVTGDHIVLSKNAQGEGTGGHMALGLRDGKARFVLGEANGNNQVAQSDETVIEAGRPTHLLATFGAAGMLVYVDGVQVAQNAYTGGLDAGLGNFEPLVIGGDSGGNQPLTPVESVATPFAGTIDEVVVYDQQLDATQVGNLFAAGQVGTTVSGTNADDTLIGGADSEAFLGRQGNDVIDAGAGNDVVGSGKGDDAIRGSVGNDVLDGRQGNDLIRGGAGTDQLFGRAGDDDLGGGPDIDVLTGNRGADILSGGEDADQLFGNRGPDQLFGRDGADLLNGGFGRDELTGGNGGDNFQISSLEDRVDHVLDFESGPGQDVLDLSAVLDGFDGDSVVADFVRLVETNGNTKVQVDADGGGNDFQTAFNLSGQTGVDLDQLVSDGNVNLGGVV